MATTVDYIEFVMDQLHIPYETRHRKMFGEYMVYANDKPILLVCDNTVFVKKHPQLEELMKDASCGLPYPSAKEHYVLDIENRELVEAVIEILEEVTPVPKKRKKKGE
ncbi:TfoX-like protein [Breznakia blatticola]|uniref:TfoX-like protein n=1 Tax=Breznakia blatticola TaxID=1754012 RepID=A0A4R8A6Y3_9FIRM|nr:TfoX/Sxy family protein [Breznakia blatticola]TDW25554.1 TfoX-like protein [Breznakia blatticola]